MDKERPHRRWLRLAVSAAIVLHSVLSPWGDGHLYANNPDILRIGVTPISTAPPAAVTDLLASPNLAVEGQISLSWTAPQGNAGGTPIANQAVAAYTIRFATFSVASMAGDTTAWWNATASSTAFLSPPSYIPQSPGGLEGHTLTGLIPGTTYFFGIKSISLGGITSPIDTKSASPALQARAVATQFPSGLGIPKRPNGLRLTASAGQFTFQWTPVTRDSSGQAIAISHYMVYRYDTIGSSPTVSTLVPVGTPTYTDTVGGLTYYYRVVAYSVGNVPSAASDYVDSSNVLNRYAIDAANLNTRIVMPYTVASELNAPANGTSDDFEIVALHQPQNENPTTLKSYLFEVQNTRTGLVVPNFAFSQPVADVQVSYALSFPALGFNSTLQSQVNEANSQAAAIAQLIGLYWFNGTSFIRLGGTVLVQNQVLTVSAKNLGLYEIRAISSPTSFALTRNSPYPRVITPNDATQNNRVFWFFDNPAGEIVTGTIYDIRGAKVADLNVDGNSPTANSLVWTGRDFNGAVVPSGVYLYKISAGKETQTGTVVVAR